MPGLSVVRGRRPGASAAGWFSSNQNICARVPRGKPSSGSTGEDCSQPPEGVAETMLPAWSMMSKWTVSPRPSPVRERLAVVGSPPPTPPIARRVPSFDDRRESRHVVADQDAAVAFAARIHDLQRAAEAIDRLGNEAL